MVVFVFNPVYTAYSESMNVMSSIYTLSIIQPSRRVGPRDWRRGDWLRDTHHGFIHT